MEQSRLLHSSSSQNQTEQCIVVSTEPELVCPHLPPCTRPILIITKAEEDIPCLREEVLGSAGDDAGSTRCAVPVSLCLCPALLLTGREKVKQM